MTPLTLTGGGVRNQIHRPTIEQLLKWNHEAHRMLETRWQVDSNWENNHREKVILVDSLNKIVDARPICGPRCLRVTTRYGNDLCFPKGVFSDMGSQLLSPGERPYHMQSGYSLTPRELQVILGYDYDERDNRAIGGHIICLNAMWQAIEQCPTYAANAYVLGVPHHLPADRSQDIMIPMQYYRITPRRHKALGISQDYVKLLWKDIEEERKEEDAVGKK